MLLISYDNSNFTTLANMFQKSVKVVKKRVKKHALNIINKSSLYVLYTTFWIWTTITNISPWITTTKNENIFKR